jgi:hypothetical protein
VKTVCLALGLARSNVQQKTQRPYDWVDGRTAAWVDPDSDALLVDAVRAEIAALPTYGYRRAGALANPTRSHIGLWSYSRKWCTG